MTNMRSIIRREYVTFKVLTKFQNVQKNGSASAETVTLAFQKTKTKSVDMTHFWNEKAFPVHCPVFGCIHYTYVEVKEIESNKSIVEDEIHTPPKRLWRLFNPDLRTSGSAGESLLLIRFVFASQKLYKFTSVMEMDPAQRI